MRSHVICPSVCPSVTLEDHDHIGWKSWKLIARTISPTSSLFVAQRSSPTLRGTWKNFAETRGRPGLSPYFRHGVCHTPLFMSLDHLYCWIIQILVLDNKSALRGVLCDCIVFLLILTVLISQTLWTCLNPAIWSEPVRGRFINWSFISLINFISPATCWKPNEQ